MEAYKPFLILDKQDRWTGISASSCIKCKNFTKNKPHCKAFPKGIPDEILLGKNKHLTKYPTQTGNLVFEFQEPKKPKNIKYKIKKAK